MRSLIALGVFSALIGLGQDRARLEFDVASVKPVDVSKLGNAISINLGTVRREQLTFGNATLNECIRFAYSIASDAQIAGPDWIKSRQFMYDIVAKGAPGSSREQLQLMMQALLTERFKLVTHREQREMSHYALVEARGGAKIQPVKEVPDGFRGTTVGGRIDSILGMPGLAYLLSRFETDRPIIDNTGLKGLYVIKLEWAQRPLQNGDALPGVSLFTAIDEQAGLKLEGRRGPVDVVVVDSAEKVPIED